MTFLKKLQEQPKTVRKIIFWVIVIILAITFLFTWLGSTKTRIETAKQEKIFDQFKPPNFESVPKVEVPKFPELSEEELKQLEEEFLRAIEQESSATETPQ